MTKIQVELLQISKKLDIAATALVEASELIVSIASEHMAIKPTTRKIVQFKVLPKPKERRKRKKVVGWHHETKF